MIQLFYNKYLVRLKNNRTLKNVSYLSLGSAISQIISLIGAFYIPRILGPKEYGVLSTVMSYVGLFTLFTFSGLNTVVLRDCSRHLEKAKEIFENSIGVRNLFSIFASLLAMLFVLFIDYDLGTKIYTSIFSLTLIFTGMRDSFEVVFRSNKRMEYIAVLSIVRSTLIVIFSIILVTLGYKVLSLILVQLIAQVVVLMISYKLSLKFMNFNIFSKVQFDKRTLQQGLNFSVLRFFSMFGGKIDLVMISILGTPYEVGIYAVAYTIFQKGLIVRAALSQSLFPDYAQKFQNGTMRIRQVFKHTAGITTVSLIIVCISALFSTKIIVSILGIQFSESALIFNTLMFALIVNYFVVPFGVFLQTSHNEKIVILVVIIRAVFNVACNIIFYRSWGILGIAYSSLVSESMSTLMQFIFGIQRINILGKKVT